MYLEIKNKEVYVDALAIDLKPFVDFINQTSTDQETEQLAVRLANLGEISVDRGRAIIYFRLPIGDTTKETELLEKMSELGNQIVEWMKLDRDATLHWYYHIYGKKEFEIEPLPDSFPKNLKLHHIWKFGSRG